MIEIQTTLNENEHEQTNKKERENVQILDTIMKLEVNGKTSINR